MKLIRVLFSFLAICIGCVSLQAADFTTLEWKGDTTRLGVTFSGAVYLHDSALPHYFYQYDLGREYASRTYTVSVEYPEYQYMEIPAGLEEQVKALPRDPLPETRLSISAHEGILQVDLLPFVYREGRLMRLTSFRLVMSEGPVARSLVRGVSLTAEAVATETYASHSLLASGRWVKISVPYSGVFKLTESKLRELGFNNPSKVRLYGYGGALLAEDLNGSHPDDLCEVPMYRGNGYALFYGKGPVSWKTNYAKTYFNRVQNVYATAGYYFLTEGEGTPLEWPLKSNSEGPSQVVTSFNERILHEEDAYNWASSGRELYESYDYVNGNKKSYTFRLTGITASKAYCTVHFAARSKAATTVEVAANSTKLGSFSINAYSETYANYYKAVDATYNGSWIPTETDENMLISLTHNRPAGIPGRLDYITINYQRDLKLSAPYMPFQVLDTAKKVITYSISGCDANTRIWDITTPGSYTQMEGALHGSTYRFTADNTSMREYMAVNVNASFESPSVVGVVPNQDLHALEQPDMVIVIPASEKWRSHAERLAEAHRQKDGMIVHVVSAAKIYNEFSSGTADVTAYRWFMKMFYDRSANGGKAPKYLLMMGDCSYDNRMLTSTWKKYDPNDFLLCYQSENSTIETASYVTDDYLGMLDKGEGMLYLSSDVMDIGVGRFPVRNADEAKVTVDKTIAYINNKELGSWKNRVCYVADDEESSQNNRFMVAAEEFAGYVEKNAPQMMVSRVYQDAFPRESTAAGFTYPQATKRLLTLIDEGLLLLNYSGHGGGNGWSAEHLLTTNHIRAMHNSRQALWITATCDFCRYDDMDYSAGEEAFLNEKGGAIALFTTSRVVDGPSNDNLNRKFTGNIFAKKNGERLRLGDIMRLSKQELKGDDNKLNFSLIGDPALMLAFPDHKIVVDSLNGKAATASDLQMRAGDVITLKGHVEDASGAMSTHFNGSVSTTVFDKKEHVKGYDHIASKTGRFEFDEYNSKLFVGGDSVRGGQFQISFPVPLDISYSNEKGMLNLYAASSTGVEGQGYFADYTVGGTAPGALKTDSLGPEIQLYLNDPSFRAGGIVNAAPYLFAELTDAEGINATGSGIGHDIMVSIDHSPIYSYVLNNYFQLTPGGYTHGTIQYQFDPLPDGDHTLYFTAWDTKNNSSTYSLPFRVEDNAAPGVSSLTCYPLPAVDDLTFHFRHNRVGVNLILTLEIFAFDGSKVWTHTLTDYASTGYYAYTWDLVSGNGSRLPEGVYMCRAHFATEGSKETTETLKFVVGAQ